MLSRLRLLEKTQWWPREMLDAYRMDRLKSLIAHAYAHVPFYRDRFDTIDLKPGDLKSLRDLSRVPILSREDLRQHCELDLRSTIHDFSRCHRGSSSGSSGDPVVYYKDVDALSAGRAAVLAGWGMAGRQLGDRTVTIWGNYRTVQYEWARPGSRVKARLYGETRIPAFQLTTSDAMQQGLSKIVSADARYLYGYTNAIYALALAARRELDTKCVIPFHGVLTTAETLTPYARKVIEETFGPVCDGYGCGEILGVAFQCRERAGYHIVEPGIIVEFEDIGLGAEKSLLLTDLDNYAMPLIRYRVGDVGVDEEGECSCGRTWRMLKAVKGRTSEIITTPKGGKLLVPSGIGSGLLKEMSGIAQYQLAQVSDEKVILRVVPTSTFDSKDVEAIMRHLEPYLSGIIDHAVQIVDQIPVASSGKHKIVVDERSKGKECSEDPVG